MQRRLLRNKKLRSALWRKTGGLCAICGCELSGNWHADHVVPWCVTKRTNVHEMQPLCPKCNLKKGAKMSDGMILRKHQQELSDFLQNTDASNFPLDILMDVTPGGGKSRLPGILAQKFPNFRIAWFVPRLSLKRQAVQDMKKNFGIILNDAGNDVDPCRECKSGFVSTHQALTTNTDLWVDELSRHKYILVIDELHHAKITRKGESNSLAKAISKLTYQIRLCMTGTLETNDKSFISTVPYKETGIGYELDLENYDDHKSKRISYSRTDALNEDAIVTVEFHYHDGPVKWENIEGIQEGVLSQVDPDKESQAVMTALKGDTAIKLFENCYDHWAKYGTTNDKLLIVTHNQDSAKKFRDILRKRGEKVGLAVSDSDSPHDDIIEFQEGRFRCLVTCQMAYEGLDVPEISHIACLTHIRSVPWIMQMLARAWRKRPGKKICSVFVPNDPAMNRVIARIKSEEKQVLPFVGEGPGPEKGESVFVPIASDVTTITSEYLDEDKVVSEAKSEIFAFCQKYGVSPDSLEAENMLRVVRQQNKSDSIPRGRELTPSETRKRMSKEIHDICTAADKRNGVEYGTHSAKLKCKTKKSTTDMTIQELERARNVAISLCS